MFAVQVSKCIIPQDQIYMWNWMFYKQWLRADMVVCRIMSYITVHFLSFCCYCCGLMVHVDGFIFISGFALWQNALLLCCIRHSKWKKQNRLFWCVEEEWGNGDKYAQNICNVTSQIHLKNLFQNNTPKVRSKASHILIPWSLTQIPKQPHKYSARRGCNIWFVILCTLTQLSTFLLSDSVDLLSFVPLVWVYCACCLFIIQAI